MKNGLSITKYNFSIVFQKLLFDFYLQFDYDKKYFLHRFFRTKFEGGIVTSYHLNWGYDPYTDYEWWIEKTRIGVALDITVLNFRFGIYLWPIIFKRKK